LVKAEARNLEFNASGLHVSAGDFNRTRACFVRRRRCNVESKCKQATLLDGFLAAPSNVARLQSNIDRNAVLRYLAKLQRLDMCPAARSVNYV
jgi:hypothetical protein